MEKKASFISYIAGVVIVAVSCSGSHRRTTPDPGGLENIPQILKKERQERLAAEEQCVAIASLPLVRHECSNMAFASRDVMARDAVLLPIEVASDVGRAVDMRAFGLLGEHPNAELPQWAEISREGRLVVTPPLEMAGAAVGVKVMNRKGVTERKMLAFGPSGATNLETFRNALGRHGECEEAIISNDLDMDGTADLIGFIEPDCGFEENTCIVAILRGRSEKRLDFIWSGNECPELFKVSPHLNGGRPGLITRGSIERGTSVVFYTLDQDSIVKVSEVWSPDHALVCLKPSSIQASLHLKSQFSPPRIQGGISPKPTGP